MEYNNDDPKGRSLPNPFKVENLFLLTTAALLLVLAIAIVILVRLHMSDDPDRVARGMVTAFLLLLTAIGLPTKSLTQLKFYVGASEPSDLSGKQLGEFLEQGDVHPFEPTGPLNGLLYTW